MLLTGCLPLSLTLNEQEIAKTAALTGFLHDWVTKVDQGVLERELAAACERGDQVERASWYRVMQRQNGRLNGSSEAWLERLAASQNG